VGNFSYSASSGRCWGSDGHPCPRGSRIRLSRCHHLNGVPFSFPARGSWSGNTFSFVLCLLPKCALRNVHEASWFHTCILLILVLFFLFQLNEHVAELDEEVLKLRMAIHCYLDTSAVRPYSCSVCHKDYSSLSNLRRHIREAHFGYFAANPDPDLKCPNCGKFFTRTCARDAHLLKNQCWFHVWMNEPRPLAIMYP
jgi:hypothetical protein